MFEVGFTEIILILGIALVVLGPEKLPKVAADIGRWVGRARAMARQFRAQLDEEVIKADRDWSRPQPRNKPRKSGLQDLDASPNRAAPPRPADPPADAPAAGTDAQATAPRAAPAAEPAAPEIQNPAEAPAETRSSRGGTDGP
jgi:sec-independent protein translocase protein TatB